MSAAADRGSAAEVRADARLDANAASVWLDRRTATLVENDQRRERRDGCLRNSALTGACAGTIGAGLMYRYTVQRRTSSWRNFLGGGGQAFQVFVGFFMPFMFFSNVVRWRCQKSGLKLQ